LLKALSTQFRKFFNVRFEALNGEIKLVQAQLDDLRTELSRVPVAATGEGRSTESSPAIASAGPVLKAIDDRHVDTLAAAALLGRSLDIAVDGLDVLLDRTDAGSPSFIGRSAEPAADPVATPAAVFDPQTRGELARLTAEDAAVANFATSHLGWASQAGYWFNPPVSLAHAAGGVKVGTINERIAENPFVYAALAGLPVGARVLDVGSTESTVAISLASLGYQVTAVDPRPYPLEHPNLRVHIGLVEEFTDEMPYDAAIALSSLEHFGLGAYQLPTARRADQVALDRIRDLLTPGGRLVLTVPYGDAPTTDLERTYRPDQLDDLLTGWDVTQSAFLTRRSPVEWVRVETVTDLSASNVAMIVARKPAG